MTKKEEINVGDGVTLIREKRSRRKHRVNIWSCLGFGFHKNLDSLYAAMEKESAKKRKKIYDEVR